MGKIESNSSAQSLDGLKAADRQLGNIGIINLKMAGFEIGGQGRFPSNSSEGMFLILIT
jgi:hypothetical protein